MDAALESRVLMLRTLGRTPRDIVTMTRLSMAEVERVLEAERQSELADVRAERKRWLRRADRRAKAESAAVG
jgi:hypothetical protein